MHDSKVHETPQNRLTNLCGNPECKCWDCICSPCECSEENPCGCENNPKGE